MLKLVVKWIWDSRNVEKRDDISSNPAYDQSTRVMVANVLLFKFYLLQSTYLKNTFFQNYITTCLLLIHFVYHDNQNSRFTGI